MSLIFDLCQDAYRRHADRIALGSATQTLSYGGLAAASRQLVADTRCLALPSAPGKSARVGIYAGNSIDYVVAYLGLVGAGSVPFLIDPSLRAIDLQRLTMECDLDAVVHDRPLPAGLPIVGTCAFGRMSISALRDATLPLRHYDLLPSTEFCRFTSGSTGGPKCIEFSGMAAINAAETWAAASDLRSTDRTVCFAGLHNGLAFNTSLLATMLQGGSLWLPAGLPSSGTAIRFLKRALPSRLVAFPALYESLARRPEHIPELASVRVALSSAANLNEATFRTLVDRHSLQVCSYYGVAETGPLTFDADPGPERGLGTPLPGVDLRIISATAGIGEVAVKSKSMGSRYLNAPGMLENRYGSDGLYRTGDLGRLDQGCFFLSSRASPILNIGGRKFDSSEVIDLIESFDLGQCVIVQRSKKNGEPLLVAVIESSHTVTQQEIRSRCLSQIASFKVPERIMVGARLPRTSSGKPHMAAINEMVDSWLDASASGHGENGSDRRVKG